MNHVIYILVTLAVGIVGGVLIGRKNKNKVDAAVALGEKVKEKL